MDDQKSSNLNIRISDRLRELIRLAAKRMGYTNESEWIRMVLEEAAGNKRARRDRE